MEIIIKMIVLMKLRLPQLMKPMMKISGRTDIRSSHVILVCVFIIDTDSFHSNHMNIFYGCQIHEKHRHDLCLIHVFTNSSSNIYFHVILVHVLIIDTNS